MTATERVRALDAAAARLRAVASAPPSRPADEDGPLAAILLCRGGRLGALAQAAGRGVEALCAFSTPIAIEFLQAGAYDALVVDAPSLGPGADRAVEEVRRIGALADLPVVVVDGERAEGSSPGAFATGLDGLAATLAERGRAYRRLRASRRELRALKRAAAAGPSGLPDGAFLTANLRHALAARERGLTLGLLAIEAEGGEPPANLRRAVGDLLAMLTRAEDVAAEIAPGRFGLVFVAADPEHAERLMTRLAGVVQNSAVLASDGRVIRASVRISAQPLGAATDAGSVVEALARGLRAAALTETRT
jgi:hypothetical protein